MHYNIVNKKKKEFYFFPFSSFFSNNIILEKIGCITSAAMYSGVLIKDEILGHSGLFSAVWTFQRVIPLNAAQYLCP